MINGGGAGREKMSKSKEALAVPDLAQAFEEVEGVDALLVGEIDNAVEAVVLDELERGIHLVRPEAERVIGGVELVAASDVAVHDGGAP